MTDRVSARPVGSGSRPTDQAQLHGPDGPRFDSSRLASLSFVLPYEDGGERLSVSHDSRSRYWTNQVVIRQYESDERIIYVDLADINWLIGALKLVAIAMEAATAGETVQQGSTEGDSAGPQDIAQHSGEVQ